MAAAMFWLKARAGWTEARGTDRVLVRLGAMSDADLKAASDEFQRLVEMAARNG